MNEIIKLRKILEDITALKPCQGSKARFAELNEAAAIVLEEYDSIPSYPRLHGYMKAVLNSKPNWGNRELMKKFDMAVKKIYG